MSDYPIIFSGPMVRALLEGRKTMTRRLAWRKARKGEKMAEGDIMEIHDREACPGTATHWKPTTWQKVRPGDRLYVQEHVYYKPESDNFYFSADRKGCGIRAYQEWRRRNRAPFHLNRWASRLTLVVTATKIEPLLDISEKDARAEGFEASQPDNGFGPDDLQTAAESFQGTWAKLHPDWDGYSSPEVVALTFTVHKTNIDSLEPA